MLRDSYSHNSLFTAFDRRIPSHRLGYWISLSPSENFVLSAAINFLGKTEWYEYQVMVSHPLSPLFEPTYSNIIDDDVLVNISAQRSFWNDRIRINASIYNLLNNEIQYHPLGGIMRLIFYLKGEIVI